MIINHNTVQFKVWNEYIDMQISSVFMTLNRRRAARTRGNIHT